MNCLPFWTVWALLVVMSLSVPILAMTSLPVPRRRVEPADVVCRLVRGQRAACAGPCQPSQWHGEAHRRRWLGSVANWLTLLLLLQLHPNLQLTEEEQKLLSQEGVSLPNNLPLTKVHLHSSPSFYSASTPFLLLLLSVLYSPMSFFLPLVLLLSFIPVLLFLHSYIFFFFSSTPHPAPFLLS